VDEKIKINLVASLALLGFGVAAAALILFLKGEPPAGGLAINVACKSDADCPVKLKCADCMECHLTQSRCVYKLMDNQYCQCVEGEIMPCDANGLPGVKSCQPTAQGAEWGTCNKI
jgi:hypothetical protein